MVKAIQSTGGKLVAGLVVAAAALLGCSGKVLDIGDDQAVAGRGGTGPAPGGGSGAGLETCESACVLSLFKARTCTACHGTALKLGGPLDLETPGISARLKDVPATHMGIAEGSICPPLGAQLLIDSTEPSESWLLKKVAGRQGTCGTVMPQVPPVLSRDEILCLESYVSCVASNPY